MASVCEVELSVPCLTKSCEQVTVQVPWASMTMRAVFFEKSTLLGPSPIVARKERGRADMITFEAKVTVVGKERGRKSELEK